MGSSQILCFIPLTLMIIQLALTINAQPIYQFCQEGNFTNGTKFQTNLNLLLSSLSSNVLTENNGFSNKTSGNNPDKVHGLFLCRGDVTNDVCQSCVTTAAEDIRKKCPSKKDAIIFYDECMLRYSNQSIFSMVQKRPSVAFLNTNNVSDPDRFKPLLGELMEELVTRATVDLSKFSTATKKFNSTQKIYGLAQCTPDLSSKGCKECLVEATSQLPTCCDGKQGARVLLPSCNVRYETYAFYRSEADHSPAPSPASLPPRSTSPSPDSLAPPPPNPTNGKEKNIFNNLLTLIMPLVVTLVLLNQFPR